MSNVRLPSYRVIDCGAAIPGRFLIQAGKGGIIVARSDTAMRAKMKVRELMAGDERRASVIDDNPVLKAGRASCT